MTLDNKNINSKDTLLKTHNRVSYHDIMYDYVILKGEFLKLPVDIAIDNFHGYAKLGITPCVFVRNGYERQDDFFPIPIQEDPPKIIDGNINIVDIDYYQMLNFVADNYQLLLSLANEELDYYLDFMKKVNSHTLHENRTIISEMSKIRPNLTGLPVAIWVDEGETYKKGGHHIRIKVQNDSNNSHEWTSLTIPEYKWIGGNISSETKKLVEKYARINVELLTSLMSQRIDLNKYLDIHNTLDDNGNIIKNDKTTLWTYCFDAGYNIKVYKHNVAPYGYMYSKDALNNLYTNEHGVGLIFDKVNSFYKNQITYASVGDKLYALNANGQFKIVESW